MRARLFQKSKKYPTFNCLHGLDVVATQVSDHHPVIHDGVLFWNIMMQGKSQDKNGVIRFNNAFAITETDKKYMNRLITIAHVIAEIINHHPSIKIIGLCEGPIEPLHLDVFSKALKKFTRMNEFLIEDGFHPPQLKIQPWGLLMLADKNLMVSKVHVDFLLPLGILDKLTNRFQLWKLKSANEIKYFALAHFPFGDDVHHTEKTKFSPLGNLYAELVNQLLHKFAKENFIVAADFNFNPYLLKDWHDRTLDKIRPNNSILLESGKSPHCIHEVTVDGILLSEKEKQQYYLRRDFKLMPKLMREFSLFKSYVEHSKRDYTHSSTLPSPSI